MNVPASELIWSDRPAAEAVEAALAAQFAVRAGAVETVERIYLDTFDALLYADRLSLRWERGRLELSRHGAELPHLTAPCGQPSGPLLATELPAGELRDAVAAIIDVRALIPRARVRVLAQGVAVLDELDKTVVRIVLESPELIGAGGSARPLAARLRLLAVRGYDGEFERVRELVTRELELHAAGATLEDEAVRAAGGSPAGVSAKLDVGLTASLRADAAAVAVLRRLMQIMDDTLPGTLADIDSEFLHDYRVSVRRTRSVLRELRGVFPPPELDAMREEFRWLQLATGDSRDLDVYVLGFALLRTLVPETMRADLDPLLTVLRSRRLVAHSEMARALRSDRARTLRRDWEALLDGLVERTVDERPDATRTITAVAGERIARVYRQMVRMGGAIGPAAPAADYHELRKKGKELRYLLELFGVPLFDEEVVRPMIKTLKALQDVLGRHQDREIQVAMLRSLRDEISSFPGGPAALMAMGVLVERLDADAADARAEFTGVFGPFASAAARARVKQEFSA